MHFGIRHEIRCKLPSPVRNLVAVLRLNPRSHEGQHVTDWWIDADLDCSLKSGYDEVGNVTHTFSAAGPVADIRISASGTIDTFDTVGVVRASAERLPPEFFLRETALTAGDGALRDFADRSTAGGGGDLARLHALMAAVAAEMALEAGGAGLPASDGFARKSGGLGTHAHVFIAGACHLGIPCRFVNGYLVRGESREAAPHAWAEAFVPGLGWIGFDPTNNLCPQGGHVRCAVGFDAMATAFVRGIAPEATTHALTVKLSE